MTVIVSSYAVLIHIIHDSRKLAETNSEATEIHK
jgi:hypothetical protein